MSPSKDIDSGTDEKPAKRTKYSDVQQQEEEEKAKDVCRDGNPPPSTPTNTATDTEGSDKMGVQLYGDESKSDSTEVGESKKGRFLFQMQLTASDVESDTLQLTPGDVGGDKRLVIPEEQERNHFPEIKIPEAATHEVETLYFTDAQNRDWCMKTIFSEEPDGYQIMDGWEGFVNGHNLKAMDVIKFYEPAQSSHASHFLVDIEKGEEAGSSGYEGDDEKGGSSQSGSSNEVEMNNSSGESCG